MSPPGLNTDPSTYIAIYGYVDSLDAWCGSPEYCEIVLDAALPPTPPPTHQIVVCDSPYCDIYCYTGANYNITVTQPSATVYCYSQAGCNMTLNVPDVWQVQTTGPLPCVTYPPTFHPTMAPVTSVPTYAPVTSLPTVSPTKSPSPGPTRKPVPPTKSPFTHSPVARPPPSCMTYKGSKLVLCPCSTLRLYSVTCGLVVHGHCFRYRTDAVFVPAWCA